MDEAPDLLQPLLGFKVFRLDQDGLYSPIWRIPRQRFWPGPNQALCPYQTASLVTYLRCGRKGHVASDPIPAPGCSCGFYAYHDREHVGRLQAGQVLALVRAPSGLVELYSRGFRAGSLELVALIETETVPRSQLEGLSQAFGVPLVRDEQVAEVIAGAGALISPQLLPSNNPGGPVPFPQRYWAALRVFCLQLPITLALFLALVNYWTEHLVWVLILSVQIFALSLFWSERRLARRVSARQGPLDQGGDQA